MSHTPQNTFSYISPIYSHNPRQGSNFPLLVLHVEHQVCTPSNKGFRVFHWHEEIQFIYVQKGSIDTKIYEEDLHICAGECLFINRMVPHKTIENTNCLYHSFIIPEKMLCFFSGSIMEQRDVVAFLYHPGFTHFHLHPDISSHIPVLHCIQKLDYLYFSSKEQLPRKEYAVSVALVTLWQAFLNVLPPLPEGASDKNYTRIQNLLSYLHSHYAKDISVTDIAEAAHISKSECLRCFHQFVGESPYQYLIKYRLYISTSLLHDTSFSITQIAAETGFASASSYIRYFKKWYGCTPKEYRKQKNSVLSS